MTDTFISVQPDTHGNAVIRTRDGRSIQSACTGRGIDALGATELLLASLGSCIAASLAPLLERHGQSPTDMQIKVRLIDDALPGVMNVCIEVPGIDENLGMRCRRAAEKCPVLRSLAAPVEIELVVKQ